MVKLKVLTFNVHSFLNFQKKDQKHNVIDWILNADYDIIALQEARLSLSGPLIQLLSPKYKVYSAPTLAGEQQTYGNIVLSKHRAKSKVIHDLSFKNKEPRNCLELNFSIEGQALKIYALHLGLSQWEKLFQVKNLFDKIIEPNRVDPEIVMGDFNHVLDWPILRYFLKKGKFQYVRKRTFPAFFPLFKLDQIWYRNLDLNYAAVSSYKHTPYSDHLPLEGEFLFRNIMT